MHASLLSRTTPSSWQVSDDPQEQAPQLRVSSNLADMIEIWGKSKGHMLMPAFWIQRLACSAPDKHTPLGQIAVAVQTVVLTSDGGGFDAALGVDEQAGPGP